MSETEIAVLNEREACAKLLEELAEERRKMSTNVPKERRVFYLETADLVTRLAMFIRERESTKA